jgi:3-oxoacyl-[acyl-carrier-protein] synthase-1
MSAPHPDGTGVHLAVTQALVRAGLEPRAIDYVNLHGTATPANDRAEDAALHRIFGDGVPCSSTKGWTGHTLGAAGVTEVIVSALCMMHSYVPGTLHTRRLDPSLKSRIVLTGEERPLRHVLSNSLGFGGNNCSLVLGMSP